MEYVTSPHILQNICTDGFLSDGALNVSALSDSTSTSTNKSQPNILKKRDFTPQGPIKNLPFSPSRFLNQKKLPGDMPVYCKITDSQEEILCISTTEDSGIEIPSCDIDSLFTNPITSTPKLKKPESSASIDYNSFEEVLHVGDNSIYSCGDSAYENKKVATTSDKVLFRSPLIRRFINESGPRTPTPFKFRFGKNSFTKTVEECKDRTVAEPCNRISYRRWAYRSPGTTKCTYKRKARKALNMDYSCLDARDTFLNSTTSNNSMRSIQAFGNLKNLGQSDYTHYINESAMNITMANSSYESQYCEVSTSGTSLSVQSEHHSTKSQQSFVYPSSSKAKAVDDVAYLSEMNEKLVRVACGLSEDQKAMTIAAKQCLRSMNSAQANDSIGIIPPNRRLSHRMLC